MHGAPIAVVEDGVIYYVRTDHIGRPVFATNAAGVKVWTASYLPFGGVRTTTGAPLALRFPGQWFQSESGLHQNWMRDYDPTSGRYLQADPLGLVDGASVYGYALQSPARYTDPRGECVGPLAYACAAAAGAAIGASIDILIQLYQNGGQLDCIDWGSVGFNAGTGAVGGVGFKAVGAAYRIYAGGRGATAAGFGDDLLNWGPSTAFEYGTKLTANSTTQINIKATQQYAMSTLLGNGYVSRIAANGTTILLNNGVRTYGFYASSGGGNVAAAVGVPTGSLAVAGKIVAKLRFLSGP